MSKFRNCINCGAPLETEKNKCPYCGTSYLDLCALKLDGKTPFILKFQAELNGKPCIISGKFVASSNISVNATTDYMHSYGGVGNTKTFLMNYTPSVSLSVDFNALPENGKLLTLEIEK